MTAKERSNRPGEEDHSASKEARPMASTGKKKAGKGTLIRGADGALYFVHNSTLRASRVPAAKAAEVRAQVECWEEAGEPNRMLAVAGFATHVSGILIKMTGKGRRKPAATARRKR
jgi:hypothetical protein